jgi:dihydrodipicolinate synthase/N-acetylneuraminate lyase
MADSDAGGLIELRRAFLRGMVIPAHPLALTAERQLDERRQVALTRYYCDAGAGGLAVAVHTTQFEIRRPEVGLLRPVLELASQAVQNWCRARQPRPVLVAGVVGATKQALNEAELAASIGYDAALLSLAAMRDADNAALIDHCRRVADIIPIVGFYLQPAVGGRPLDRHFWRSFLDIDRVVAIKVAPFDRYRTLDVTGALAESGRHDVALYTGNDDAIVPDLLTPFPSVDGEPRVQFHGGLLGQWAVGTRRAVGLLHRCHAVVRHELAAGEEGAETLRLLALGAELTDLNAALFDPANGFAGCIAGIHEVLRRQGLLAGRWCLNPEEDLSPGQIEAIDRLLARYPHLMDDEFIAERLDEWMKQ